MVQFSLRRMFGAVALMAVGLSLLAAMRREYSVPHAVALPVVFLPLCAVSGAVVGAGLLLPVRGSGLGAAIGAMTFVAFALQLLGID